METEPHPPQQSPPVIASMHDERLQPHPQSFEFTEQPHHHQEDYGYNPHVLSASGEEFMSNLIGKDLRTLESAYTYMQRMVFKYTANPKVIIISEDMLLVTLRKIIFDANGGYKILINHFTVNQST
ncbi:hypothetical protein GmHk_U059664 [Glycine max]|nr:hypothetical protein GmHk_U059664 [Glycine max]